jgi:hypothetical protein
VHNAGEREKGQGWGWGAGRVGSPTRCGRARPGGRATRRHTHHGNNGWAVPVNAAATVVVVVVVVVTVAKPAHHAGHGGTSGNASSPAPTAAAVAGLHAIPRTCAPRPSGDWYHINLQGGGVGCGPQLLLQLAVGGGEGGKEAGQSVHDCSQGGHIHDRKPQPTPPPRTHTPHQHRCHSITNKGPASSGQLWVGSRGEDKNTQPQHALACCVRRAVPPPRAASASTSMHARARTHIHGTHKRQVRYELTRMLKRIGGSRQGGGCTAPPLTQGWAGLQHAQGVTHGQRPAAHIQSPRWR